MLGLLVIFAPLLVARLVVSVPSLYQIYNYTWIINNQAGDIVNSSSYTGASPHWPNLEVDLCALALGAHPDWGTAEVLYRPGSPAPQLQARCPIVPGCRNDIERADLHGQLGIYICPGNHRNKGLNHKCGWADDYFCASWGCETTGDTYWQPSSSWDYITLKRKNRYPGVTPNHIPDLLKQQCNAAHTTMKGWCNPPVISFTGEGKKQTWTGRGYEWGLRLYISGKDIGLTFKIKMLQNIPNRASAAIRSQPRPSTKASRCS